jgi:carbonic anhydrase
MRAAILGNVEETLNDLLADSSILREFGRSGRVTFVGAYYELTTGKVYFSEPASVPPTSAPEARSLGDQHH